jgi:hypothetical protein
MMTIEATRDVIATSLRRTGLAGRGSVWRRRGSDVQWVVHIDQLPYGHRLGIDIGLDLQTESTPARPTDCAILLHVENLGIVDQSLILQALDLDSSIADADRREALEGAASALGSTSLRASALMLFAMPIATRSSTRASFARTLASPSNRRSGRIHDAAPMNWTVRLRRDPG